MRLSTDRRRGYVILESGNKDDLADQVVGLIEKGWITSTASFQVVVQGDALIFFQAMELYETDRSV